MGDLPGLSESEGAVLKVLWARGPSTVRELVDDLKTEGRRWAYTTVLTLLNRLETKGYVTSDKSGFAHVFRAVVTRDKLLRQSVSDLAKQFCDGSASPLLQALVKGSRFSEEDIQHFRELVEELEQKRQRK